LNLLRDFSNSEDNKASLYLNWKINKSLNLTSTISYLYRNSTRNQEVLAGYTNPTTPYSITNTFSNGSIWLQENYLTYDLKIKKSPVQLNVVAGNTLQGTNLKGDSFKDNVEIAGAKSQITNTLASFYGRFNFNYDYRYLLTGTVRTDASSRFGKRLWVNKNLPGTKLILAAADKKQNYSKPNRILIDDKESNVEQWRSQGGIGILHKNTADTIKQLQQYEL
jgi:hypothetical protein